MQKVITFKTPHSIISYLGLTGGQEIFLFSSWRGIDFRSPHSIFVVIEADTRGHNLKNVPDAGTRGNAYSLPPHIAHCYEGRIGIDRSITS